MFSGLNSQGDLVEERLVKQLKNCIEGTLSQNRNNFPGCSFNDMPNLQVSLENIIRLEINQIPKIKDFVDAAKKHITNAAAGIVQDYISLANDLYNNARENREKLTRNVNRVMGLVTLASFLGIEAYYSLRHGTTFSKELLNNNTEFLKENIRYLFGILSAPIFIASPVFVYLSGFITQSRLTKGASPKIRREFYQRREELFDAIRQAYQEARIYAKN